MLHRPFLDTMNISFDEYSKKSFSESPSLSNLIAEVLRGNVEKNLMIKIVFPFLFAIGLLQAVFFAYHIFYVVSALTTLEYKILLDWKFDQLVGHSSSTCIIPHNPFNKGWSLNLENTFGPFFLIFLPIQVDPEEVNTDKSD